MLINPENTIEEELPQEVSVISEMETIPLNNLNKFNDEIDDLSEAGIDVQSLSDKIMFLSTEKGLNKQETMLVRKIINYTYNRLDINTNKIDLALESLETGGNSSIYTVELIEEIKNTLKAIWIKIKETINKFLNFIGSIIEKIFNSIPVRIKRNEKLQKQILKTNEVKDNTSKNHDTLSSIDSVIKTIKEKQKKNKEDLDNPEEQLTEALKAKGFTDEEIKIAIIKQVKLNSKKAKLTESDLLVLGDNNFNVNFTTVQNNINEVKDILKTIVLTEPLIKSCIFIVNKLKELVDKDELNEEEILKIKGASAQTSYNFLIKPFSKLNFTIQKPDEKESENNDIIEAESKKFFCNTQIKVTVVGVKNGFTKSIKITDQSIKPEDNLESKDPDVLTAKESNELLDDVKTLLRQVAFSRSSIMEIVKTIKEYVTAIDQLVKITTDKNITNPIITEIVNKSGVTASAFTFIPNTLFRIVVDLDLAVNRYIHNHGDFILTDESTTEE